MGGRESSHVTFTQTVDKDRLVMAKKPHCSLLENELLKNLVYLYFTSHFLFIFFLFFLILSVKLELESAPFHMGSKHLLVLF